jgi:predicted esterase
VIIGSGLLGGAAGVGGWAVLANARLVPGRGLVDSALGRCDITAPPPPQAAPGRVFRSSFYSRKRGRSVNYMIAYPPKTGPGAKLPVCLCLHGLGEDERSPFDGLGLHKVLAATVGYVAPGGKLVGAIPPFVLASVSGGDGYWHPHPGDDPLGMLTTEFPQVLAQHGLPTGRFGLLGWSMGGFGALLAATEDPGRYPVVVANSPAFWPSYDDANDVNPTAFTDADEWRRWGDLDARVDRLRPVAVRIDCGESDPFEPALEDLRDRLPDPSVVHLAPGCHDGRFWGSVAHQQLTLIGGQLTPPKTT